MNLPIAMFHHVADHAHPSLKGWTVSTEKFNLFLDTITNKGYCTTTFEEIKNAEKTFSSRNKIILTFDDCPASLFDYAIPELIKRNMKAVFFIPTAQIGGTNVWDIEEQGFAKIDLMSSNQLKQLAKAGMEIGAHGHNHERPGTDENIAREEIFGSKSILEALLAKKINSFAYPYGEIPLHYPKLLKTAGYNYAVAIYTARQTNFALRRFGIHESDTQKSIEFKLGGTYALLRAFADPLLRIFKSLRA